MKLSLKLNSQATLLKVATDANHPEIPKNWPEGDVPSHTPILTDSPRSSAPQCLIHKSSCIDGPGKRGRTTVNQWES